MRAAIAATSSVPSAPGLPASGADLWVAEPVHVRLEPAAVGLRARLGQATQDAARPFDAHARLEGELAGRLVPALSLGMVEDAGDAPALLAAPGLARLGEAPLGRGVVMGGARRRRGRLGHPHSLCWAAGQAAVEEVGELGHGLARWHDGVGEPELDRARPEIDVGLSGAHVGRVKRAVPGHEVDEGLVEMIDIGLDAARRVGTQGLVGVALPLQGPGLDDRHLLPLHRQLLAAVEMGGDDADAAKRAGRRHGDPVGAGG